MKAKKKWIRFRHRIVTKVAFILLYPYIKLKYGIHIERFRKQGDRAYLILLNHQTPFDQFFVGISFLRHPVYYLATEDIFSLGWISKVIRWLIAPIPIRKQTTDASAVMTCLRVAREGGTIAIAPEGNRTYSGRTEYINPAITGLARKMKLPIALYRIEGGYGVQPRWTDRIRKGPIRSYVSRVIEPEEFQQMSNNELYDAICQGLYVDEAAPVGNYSSSKRAEYLERAVYVCPVCGFSKFESFGNRISCTTCHKTIHYGVDKKLKGIDFEFPFEYVANWYDYQNDYVNSYNPAQYTDQPVFCDKACISEVMLYQKKILLLENAKIRLYGDRITINEDTETMLVLHFDAVSAASVLGKNKLNIYHDQKVYQFKGDKRFNALKYVNLYYRYRNISRGEADNRFLGL